MSIEFLNLDNLEEALDFAEMSHLNSAWQDYTFERDTLRANLIPRIGKSYYFNCLYRQDGEIIGYWLAALCRIMCSSKIRGEEDGIYVSKSNRGGRAAVMMYSEYKKWCILNHAEPVDYVHFGSDEDNKQAYAFFKGLGMIECGRIFRGGVSGMR